MSRASQQRRLWLPQHWPMWAGLFLFRGLTWLPWPVQRTLARILGCFVFYVVRLRRHVTLVNLRLCFPEKSAAEVHALARAHFDALALGLFETCAAWWTPARRLPPHRIVGREHLDQAIAAGKGVILLTAHFTTLEIAGRYMTEAFKLACLYRDPNNPVVAHEMRLSREARMGLAVHFDDLKGLIRALRAGWAVWYGPDQAKRTKMTEILPFFGVPAITNTATSKLAGMTGAAVVPYFARRERDYSYTLTISPPLQDFPTADATADSIRINQLIEQNVRLAPEQYFWVHKRFKARGPGYPEVY